jgi:hypothetical protein
MSDKTEKIRALNDCFRKCLTGGRVLLTLGVHALGPVRLQRLVNAVRTFNAFGPDNDPHGEHDFGAFDEGADRFFWKIDLYEDPNVKDDKGEPKVTRVLTIMMAEEY